MTAKGRFPRQSVEQRPVGEREKEALLQLLYLCPVGISKLDAYGSIELINPCAAEMLMPLTANRRLTNLFDLFNAFAPEIGEMARRFPGPAGIVCRDHRVVLPLSRQVKGAILSVTLRKVDSATYIAVLTDVTAAGQRELCVYKSEERLHAVLEGVKDYAICSVDADGIVTSWNRAAERLDDYRRDEAIGRHIDFLVAWTTLKKSPMTRALEIAARDGSYEFEGWRVRKHGQRYWASTTLGRLHTKDATPAIGFSVITRDLTEGRRAEDRLRLLALSDPLTGVLNRRSFFDNAKRAQARVAAARGAFAVLVFEADRFEGVDDKRRQGADDATLLRIVADCRAEIRAGDIFGRIGDGEFVILLPSSTAFIARGIAERIRARIEQSGREPGAVACTVSIGVAATATPGETIETLLKRADVALCVAKADGRNRVVAADAA
jgi:diguanylate cyclase (GGDEF)-like protein/PAS domain S-box-containing protein